MKSRTTHFNDLAAEMQSGAIASLDDLKRAIERRGWTVHRVGEDFVTIRAPSCTFRFRFDFGSGGIACWVYILFARDTAGRFAGYVGCTTSLGARLALHAQAKRRALSAEYSKSSADLFLWAKEQNVQVQFVVLEECRGRARMYQRERLWQEAAHAEGLLMPGYDRWRSKANRPIATLPEAALSKPVFDLNLLRPTAPTLGEAMSLYEQAEQERPKSPA